MPPLLRSRLPVTSQFTIITRYAIVTGIRLHASATARLNGDLLFSVALFHSLRRSRNTRARGSPAIVKLHVTETRETRSELPPPPPTGGRRRQRANSLILRFPSASGRERTVSGSGRETP